MIEVTRSVPVIIQTYFVTDITLNAGTLDAGSIADTQSANTDYYVVNEIAATPGFDVEITFGGAITEMDIIKFWGKYDGGNVHEVEAEIWNWETSAWDDLRSGTSDLPISTTDYYREWLIPGTKSDYAHATSGHKMRFYHTSDGTASHDLDIDKICIEG
jgi:hypothetical protein